MAFQEVTAVRPLTADTYGVDLSDDWCIGSGEFLQTERDINAFSRHVASY